MVVGKEIRRLPEPPASAFVSSALLMVASAAFDAYMLPFVMLLCHGEAPRRQGRGWRRPTRVLEGEGDDSLPWLLLSAFSGHEEHRPGEDLRTATCQHPSVKPHGQGSLRHPRHHP